MERVAPHSPFDVWIFHCLFDKRANAIEVRVHITIREAQDAKSLFIKIFRAALVMQICLIAAMRISIEFYDEMGIVANEICDIKADGLLPLEFPWTATQVVIPQMAFRWCHHFPQDTGAPLGDGTIRARSHAKHLSFKKFPRPRPEWRGGLPCPLRARSSS